MTMPLPLRWRTEALFTRICGGRLPPSPTRRFERGRRRCDPRGVRASRGRGFPRGAGAGGACRICEQCARRARCAQGRIHEAVRGAGQASPAPPWESVYVCGEDLLFQPSTLEVREAYRRRYQATGYPHEADDHLATELDFMGALSSTQAAYEEGDDDAARLLISKQVYFLGTHLNSWLPQYTERLLGAEKPKVSDFYRHFPVLAQELCVADSAALEEIARLRGVKIRLASDACVCSDAFYFLSDGFLRQAAGDIIANRRANRGILSCRIRRRF